MDGSDEERESGVNGEDERVVAAGGIGGSVAGLTEITVDLECENLYCIQLPEG